jgi:CBS-domain-containing membrane protein
MPPSCRFATASRGYIGFPAHRYRTHGPDRASHAGGSDLGGYTSAKERHSVGRTTPPNADTREARTIVPLHPIAGDMIAVVRGLIARLKLPWLLRHHHRLPVLALFALLNGLMSIAVMALLALVTGSPFIFPSLGPSAFLFFYTPTSPAASPRSAILGHGIGVAAGYLSLALTGLTFAEPALTTGVTLPRVIAAALSLGLTAAAMVLLRAPHPPAGATTLIVALGLLTRPLHLLILMAAVVLLTAQAFVINRLAGVPYPAWGYPAEPPDVLHARH